MPWHLTKPVALLICDVQGKFRSSIFAFEHVARMSKKMVRAAQIFEWPVLATEQSVQAFGPTWEPLRHEIQRTPMHAIQAKTAFSMLDDSILSSMLKQASQKQDAWQEYDYILCGMESHICILQTALDLRKHGCKVHIPHDAISATRAEQTPLALQTLRDAGVHISSTDSLLYQVLRNTSHPKFGSIMSLMAQEQHHTAQALSTLSKIM
ncbi:hypothetical protein ACI68E_001782 [Malassezia pachydermatis]